MSHIDAVALAPGNTITPTVPGNGLLCCSPPSSIIDMPFGGIVNDSHARLFIVDGHISGSRNKGTTGGTTTKDGAGGPCMDGIDTRGTSQASPMLLLLLSAWSGL
jgi:hypothetical protein